MVPTRLLARFDRAALTVVSAPAGFGKTTLLHAWRECAGDTPKALASFAARDRSNALDVGRVLVEALETLGVASAAAAKLASLLPPDGSSFGSEFLGTAGPALRALEGAWVLFLDDIHGLSAAAERDLGRLASMVADEQHRVVIATRTKPCWPVERWQVAGFAQLLTAEDLRLTSDELATELGPEHAALVSRVATATEGWAAAVEAIRWRLQIDSDIEVEAAVLDLVGYVGTEVLAALDPADVFVLSRTAILDPFPVSVATAVTGDARTAGVLEETARRTSLVTRRTDGRYGYHAVLREALRCRLDEHEPEIVAELHVRAADAWLDEPASLDNLVGAVDHLIAAQRWERVVALVRRRWPELDVRSRMDLLAGWFDAIPGHCWRDDIELSLLHGWSRLRIGQAARALDEFRDPAIADDPHLAAAAWLLYASTMTFSADPAAVLARSAQLTALLPGLDDDTRLRRVPSYVGGTNFTFVAESSLLTATTLVGRWAEAAHGYERLLEHRAEMSPMAQVGLGGALAICRAMGGQVAAASVVADEALQLAVDTGAGEHFRTAIALFAQAVVATLTGDRVTAIRSLDAAVERGRVVRAANFLRLCDLGAAMIHARRSFLADVEPGLAPSPLPLVEQFVVAAAARERARRGDVIGAEAELCTSTPHELTLSAWTEVLLAVHDRRAVGRWLRSQPPARTLPGRVVRYLVDAAVTERSGEVTALTNAAATAAAPEKLLGLILGAPSQLWSRPGVTHNAHPLLLDAVQRLAAVAPDDGRPPLTQREVDLLRLLPLSLTVDELADRLFVSASTVKWHRRNLYRKLGVRRRNEAIDIAAERGLLDEPT